MTTAQDIFELAIALMDSQDANGKADGSDNAEYKNRTLNILNILAVELYPYSDTYDATDEGRPTVTKIAAFDKPIDLDDGICVGVMPYGLAAHLLVAEDPATANYFQQRYDELKARLSVGMPSVSEDIVDVYGGRGGIEPYNYFGEWS